MPTASGAPVTANEINVTLTAQGDFQDAVNKMVAIGNLVVEQGGSQLASSAMVTTAGAKYAQAIQMWAEDFNDIKNTLQWMTDQLGITAQKLQAGNQQNEEMAASLPTFNDSTAINAQPIP